MTLKKLFTQKEAGNSYTGLLYYDHLGFNSGKHLSMCFRSVNCC